MADPRKPKADWEAIGVLYRANTCSVREIAKQFDLSESGVRKKAREMGWERNLSAEIQRKTEAIVARQVAGITKKAIPAGEQDEEAIIEGAAKVAADVVMEHRVIAHRARDVALRIMNEIEMATTHNAELVEMIEEMTQPEDDDTDGEIRSKEARRKALLKAVDIPARAGSLRQLAGVVKDIVGVERQALGLKDGDGREKTEDALADLMKAVDTGGVQLVRKRD